MYGNLALIGVGPNSKFSNNLPANEIRFRETIQKSAKLQLMAERVAVSGVWDRETTRDHDQAMIELIRDDLQGGGLIV